MYRLNIIPLYKELGIAPDLYIIVIQIYYNYIEIEC